ncbi:hypothetical protein [Actinoplanes sp. NPDC051494]|uniref:hypothetical protein n=1 Tax=Actinoplanes sp. NPDC051494 TaxID=3363907 RepID=UPI0037B05C31
MTTYLLSLGILALVLCTGLGTHELSVRRAVRPVLIVLAVAAFYLRSFPTAGNDVRLDLVGVAAGVLLGVATGLLVKVRRDATTGRIVTTAGVAFATLWIAVTVGRMLFVYGTDHWFAAGIVTFSREHLITGADAWTAAFILLSLTMVLARLATTFALAARRPAPVATVR